MTRTKRTNRKGKHMSKFEPQITDFDAATDDAPYDDLGYDGATVWEQRLQSLFGRDFDVEWIDAWTVRIRSRQLLVMLEKMSVPV